jgi:DNA-binding transcriptional MerR regulator
MSIYDGKTDTYTSKQVCRAANVTPRQLRYWHHTGLITPSVQDNRDEVYPKGRPGVPIIWSHADLLRVERIGWARQVMPLQQVRTVLIRQRAAAAAGR